MKVSLRALKWLVVSVSMVFPVVVYSQSSIANFEKGVGRNNISSEIKGAMWNAQDGPFLADGLIESEESGIYYWLFRSSSINRFNVNNSQHLGGWPLTPYIHHLFLFGEYPAAASALAEAKGQTPPAPQAPLTPVADDPVSYSLSQKGLQKRTYGCFTQSPLRYGDMDGDTQLELVLFLDNTVVFFSPQQGVVTFSYHFWLEDEASSDSLIYHEESPIMQGITPSDPIYFAESGGDVLVMERYPAKRSLTKLYVGDYFQEDRQDIVLWRKLYESNARSVAQGGFRLIGNYYAHYVKQTDGTYAPADTEQNQLQNILTANSLTWPQGYPSQGECTGQEGRFILEMHDPLLNDPDILPLTP